MTGLKRTVTLEPDENIPRLSKRVKTLERKQKRTPGYQLSYHTYNSTGSAIANGAVQVIKLSPTATDVKIMRVEAMGNLGGSNVDVYLVQGRNGTAPVYASFQAYIGGKIVQAKQDEFIIWKHYLPLHAGQNFKITQPFKFGFKVHHDSGTLKGNGLWLVIKNNSGGSVTPSVAATTYSVMNNGN